MQPCDLTKAADCQTLVDFAVRTYGRIDVLFNNAAITYFNWIEDISDEEWDRSRRSEVDVVFCLTRAAWPHLKASRGVVVNTASLTVLMSFKNWALLVDDATQSLEASEIALRSDQFAAVLDRQGRNLRIADQ